MDEGDWLPAKEVAAAARFVVDRRDIDDALIVYSESDTGEKMRVRSIYWYRNYQSDKKLAKGERKEDISHVKSIPLAEIDRLFSFALNPYDSEKVAAREKKK